MSDSRQFKFMVCSCLCYFIIALGVGVAIFLLIKFDDGDTFSFLSTDAKKEQ